MTIELKIKKTKFGRIISRNFIQPISLCAHYWPNLDWTSKTHLVISILPTISSTFTSQTFPSKNNQNFNLKKLLDNKLLADFTWKKKWEWKKILIEKLSWSSFDFLLAQFLSGFRTLTVCLFKLYLFSVERLIWLFVAWWKAYGIGIWIMKCNFYCGNIERENRGK